ncbi:MAG TPA: IS110 family transposase [Eggerthellaceae bacterium]|nr:IS110 family transposase [Eggerthellaceae bacterium]
MYCVGIDVAKYKHSAAVIGERGERLLVGFDFMNDAEGFAAFLKQLETIGVLQRQAHEGGDNPTAPEPDGPKSHLRESDLRESHPELSNALEPHHEHPVGVCLEATGHYGRNLVEFLKAHGMEVYEVNPLLTSNWRKAMNIRNVKNDRVDAEALALWLYAGNPARHYHEKSRMDDLRSLTRFRFYVSRVSGDCKRKAVSLLDMLFPEYHRLFADCFCKASIAVLKKWPGARALSGASASSIEEELRAASRNSFGYAKAQDLQRAARSSIGQSSEYLEFQLRQQLAFIEFAQEQLAAIDRVLARAVEGELIMSITGIGVVCAAGILSELGGISRFSRAAQIVAFAGCDPSVYESGEFEGTRAHLSKRGSRYLRWYLWVAADRARRYDPALHAYYEKKRAEGKCHKVAVSAVVRKLCAIVFAVYRDGKPYACRADSQ